MTGRVRTRMIVIILRTCSSEAVMSDDVKAQLLEFRDSIDNIDAALVHLLAERFKITQKVGHFKAEHTPPRQIKTGRLPRSHIFASSPRNQISTLISLRKF